MSISVYNDGAGYADETEKRKEMIGKRVLIYNDPLTRKSLEGKAKIISIRDKSDEAGYYIGLVRFLGDQQQVTRRFSLDDLCTDGADTRPADSPIYSRNHSVSRQLEMLYCESGSDLKTYLAEFREFIDRLACVEDQGACCDMKAGMMAEAFEFIQEKLKDTYDQSHYIVSPCQICAAIDAKRAASEYLQRQIDATTDANDLNALKYLQENLK